jgi:hypothetical protein
VDSGRRFKVVRLSPEDVLQALAWRERQGLVLFDWEGLPDGSRVVALHAEELPLRFSVVVEHPSFEPVPDGEAPPVLRPHRVMVRLDWSESDPYTLVVPPKED